ncbi:Sugar transporter STL1 [Hyphodiscus hymeniophilus]|uniref:Sugar transporter STL1 n=1 Tax=Hyphodiscus hymeniophilus TaxID=353542 RepID=A0A9P7AU46_9HELO|nr:Sugar transporter STL1 [Hyphodiscus hymeniophilus]
MARFFGLRGDALGRAMIWAVIMPAYILFGYNNAVCGGLLNLPAWIETFPRINTATTTGAEKTNNSRVQALVAMYTLGCFFGALNCIWLGDRLGRKRTIMLGAFINIIGAIIQSTSFSLAQLIIGRLVSGLGFGALTATAPNWQSECSRAKHRGSTVLLEGLFISMGLAIAAWTTFGMSHATGSKTFRFPMALSALWSIIVIAMVPNMPESPRWLIKHDRLAEARTVLAALSDVPEDDQQINIDVSEIEESLLITGKGKFKDIFRPSEQRLFHRACLAAAGQMFQQMCGINALAFYQNTIFEQDLGLSTEIARILGACVFTFQMLCSPIGVLTVDRLGRRKLMMFAAFGMGTCMAIIAGTSSQSQSTSCVVVAAVFIFMFSFFFPTGFLGLTFLYAAEVSPLSVRVPITSLSTGSAWLFNFLVAEITPVGFATLGYKYYIIYACINFFLILPGVYFFFPETAGRHLEEVDQIFLDSKNIFQAVKVARSMPKREESNEIAGEKVAEVVDQVEGSDK